LAATKKKHKPSRRVSKPTQAELKRRAAKAAETRRSNAVAATRKQARALAKRRETLRLKAEAHERRSLAAKKGARTRRAKERARSALETFVGAVDKRAPLRELERVKESWRRAKRELEGALSEDYERYLEILDDLADESGTEWDIAYGSTEHAA
jgi:hypothetical protein